MNSSLILFARMICVVVVLLSTTGHAQEYPAKQVTMVVPYPPGSGSDVVARILAHHLTDAFKQSVIIENRGGASTNIGTEFVARATADGYTLLFQAPNLATNETLFDNLKWSSRDFAGIIHVANYSNVLVAGPGAKVSDFKEMVAQSKVNPKAFSYGSPGVGSVSHLATELLKQKTGLLVEHVSYRGPAQMAVDLTAGHLPYAVSNVNNVFSAAKESKGTIKPVVVLSQRRDPSIPDVPSLADLGITDVEGSGWYVVVAPAKTPSAVIARLNTEINKILKQPMVLDRLKVMNMVIVGGTAEEANRFVASESLKWGAIVKAAHIRAEP